MAKFGLAAIVLPSTRRVTLQLRSGRNRPADFDSAQPAQPAGFDSAQPAAIFIIEIAAG
jgi:hypothetical protein